MRENKGNTRCIVVDVGNTSTTVGYYSRGRVSRVTRVPGGIGRNAELCASALQKAAGASGVCGAIVGSVMPKFNIRWSRTIKRVLGHAPLIAGPEHCRGIEIDYPKPQAIGIDRLANACGGARRYGAPLLVADFGTALTFDIIMSGPSYVGGVIAPGLPLITDYLYERTALLPRVNLRGKAASMGRSTRDAMRIGARIGFRGMVREIAEWLRERTGERFRLVATGGYASWALEGSNIEYELDPHLTLFGLGCIYEGSEV